jgi:hypothetical protein
MDDDTNRSSARVPDSAISARDEGGLHPLIYRIAVGLAVILALGIYGFAGGTQKYNGLVLAAAILFVFATVGIASVLRHIGQRRQVRDGRPGRFRVWLGREVEVWQGHLKGSDAATTALLPLVAVSVGMVIFAIEVRLILHG